MCIKFIQLFYFTKVRKCYTDYFLIIIIILKTKRVEFEPYVNTIGRDAHSRISEFHQAINVIIQRAKEYWASS